MDHQGLTAKQWSEKGTGGHFGGVVLSPSYRHVRLYLKHIHIYFNTLGASKWENASPRRRFKKSEQYKGGTLLGEFREIISNLHLMQPIKQTI